MEIVISDSKERNQKSESNYEILFSDCSLYSSFFYVFAFIIFLQRLHNRFQGVEIHEVHLFAVGGDQGADFGVALRFGDFRDLRIQKLHHDSVFQTEFGVIDGAASSPPSFGLYKRTLKKSLFLRLGNFFCRAY